MQISIYRNFSHKVLQKVEDGSVDVGIVTLPAKSPSLKIHSIFRDRVMLMVSPRNPAGEAQDRPHEGHRRAAPDFSAHRIHAAIAGQAFPALPPQLQITMELTSVGMIKCFVAAGLGVSLISASFARNEVRAGEVKLIPIADVELWRELGIVYRRDRTLPRSSAAFIALVRQRAAENPDLEMVQPRKGAAESLQHWHQNQPHFNSLCTSVFGCLRKLGFAPIESSIAPQSDRLSSPYRLRSSMES